MEQDDKVQVPDQTQTPFTENDPEKKAVPLNRQVKTKNDFEKVFSDYSQQKVTMANGFTQATTQNAQDQFFYNRPSAYNPDSINNINQNFDRYYSHSSFSKLGFNPWRDNENLYNEQGSKWGDVSRAIMAGSKLVPTGFMSAIRSYGDVLQGDFLAQDKESEQEMKRLNTVGMSTRGGLTGFTSNMLTNAGYTVGLGAEMAAEAVIGAALTPETLGGSAVVGVTRLGMGVKNIGKYFNVVSGFNKAVSALKDFNVAKTAYNALRGTASFVNPLSHTTELVKTLRASQDLTNLAKVSKTAAAFHKDVMMANATLAEAKLEGASATADLKQDLINQFYLEKSRLPDGDEMRKIEESAKEAGDNTLVWNMPAIFLTNKITFDPLFKRFAPMEDYITKAGSKLIEKPGEGFVRESLGTSLKGLLKPRIYGKAALSYFKGNLSEGLQESMQEVISGASKDYYKDIYNHPSKQGLDQSVGENYAPEVSGLVGKNVADQFSGKGFETFASGFFMGGLLKVQGALVQGAKVGYTHIFDKERYQAYKTAKAEYDTKTLSTLNELYKDPLKFFGARILNYGNSANTIDNQNKAAGQDNKKTWQDVDDQNVWSHIMTALDTNTYDVFLDKLHSIQTMDVDSIKKAYGVDGQEVLNKINNIKDRAEFIKDNYNTWNNQAANPFNPKGFKVGTPEYEKEAIAYSAWEQAKKNAIFYGYSMERNLERIKSIKQDVLATKTFQNIPANDISVLMDVPSMNKELSLLTGEIKDLKGIAGIDARNELNKKQRRLELLTDFRQKLEHYFITQSAENLSDEEKQTYFQDFKDFQKTTDGQLKKAYTNYVKHLAAQHNTLYLSDPEVNSSFEALKDVHSLKSEVRNLSSTVNMLADPKGFHDHYDRMNNIMNEMYSNREKLLGESVKNTYGKIETNLLVNNLYRLGYVVNDQELSQILDEDKVPDQFYNVVSKQSVTKGDRDYTAFEAIVKDFISAKKGEPVVEEKVVESVVEKPVEEKPTPVVEEKVSTKPKPVSKYDAKTKLDAIKTGEDLLNYEMEIMPILGNYDKMVEAGIDKDTQVQIQQGIESLRKGLVEGFNPNNLEEGNVVLLSDDKKAIIEKVSPAFVIARVLDDEHIITKTIKTANLRKSIKFKLSDTMQTEKVEKPDKKEAENIQTNQQLTEDFSQDPTVLRALQEQADKDGVDKVNKDFINNLGCK